MYNNALNLLNNKSDIFAKGKLCPSLHTIYGGRGPEGGMGLHRIEHNFLFSNQNRDKNLVLSSITQNNLKTYKSV